MEERGSFIGFFVGILPAAGATHSLDMALQKTSKDPSKYGKGAVDGVAAPEAANVASTGAMLTLSPVFRSPTMAVLLAGVQSGLQPGPLLFSDQPDLSGR